ncbi:MAG: isopentenyl-diphosphate delta-isomerase [Bacteroidetes bacterium]|nr:isopentenyl-diphosphate delta-isomerase [Bacteroidota bacterium]
MSGTDESKRKSDHIELAFKAQVPEPDARFYYEPLFAAHPEHVALPPRVLAGRILKAPIWISSMTGGAAKAGLINYRLAKAAAHFGLGMGLGSCRPLLENNESLADFNVRSIIGDQPLFANLGIAQLEQLQAHDKMASVLEMMKRIEADGLIIHVNPLQEWMQPEGDKIKVAPIETIKRTLDTLRLPIMVKEVGQGFGPESMKALLQLPLEAVDFGALGGTNFSLLELLRHDEAHFEAYKGMASVGHNAAQMTEMVLQHYHREPESIKARNIIVSGGINTYLDGYYHIRRIPLPALYGQASAFLKKALEGEEALFRFIELEIKGLQLAWQYLKPKTT